jgi:hypothetical protein
MLQKRVYEKFDYLPMWVACDLITLWPLNGTLIGTAGGKCRFVETFLH